MESFTQKKSCGKDSPEKPGAVVGLAELPVVEVTGGEMEKKVELESSNKRIVGPDGLEKT